jgi:uncharacterized membrane protein YccC
VAQWLATSSQPLLAPLTALIVVQVTLFSTLTNGLQRVISVVAGVTLAVVFSSVVGLTWWSLGALIAASVVMGQLLRLGPHMVEVPISAMLVLGLGVGVEGAESAAAGRIVETLVGAVVGVLVNVMFPPPVQARHAGAAVEKFAAEMAGLLDQVAEGLVTGASREQASAWLEDARRLNRHVPRVDRALVHAEESRRLNLRALGLPESGLGLRGGLEALEHCSVAVRSLCRSILDAIRARPDQGEGYPDDVRRAFQVLLQGLAAAVRSFGGFVRAQVEASGEPEAMALAVAVRDLGENRERMTEVLLVDPRDDPALWELNSAFLAAVDRVLSELDVEEHNRLRESRLREVAKRPRSVKAVDRLRSATRQFADRPRRRRSREPPATTAE